MIELDHLVCNHLPNSIMEWHAQAFDADADPTRRKTINVWDDLTILQHMDVVNYLKHQVEHKFMVPVMLEHADKPSSEHSNSKDDDHEIKRLMGESVTYHGDTFEMPKEAQEHGVKGPIVEQYVANIAKEIVENHMYNAVVQVACEAVWHTCMFYGRENKQEEHHLERIKQHHKIGEKMQQEKQKENENEKEKVLIVIKKESDIESSEEKRQPRSRKKSTHLKNSDLIDMVTSANNLSRASHRLHHASDAKERLEDQLKLCWDNDIDGCNYNNGQHDNWTPLMIAAYNNHFEAVEILLNASSGRPIARWDATNCFGQTAMHLIASSTTGTEDTKEAEQILMCIAKAAGIMKAGDTKECLNALEEVLSRRTFPHKIGAPTHIHTAYMYGKKAVDYEKEHDDTYEHLIHDKKGKCCGFRAPRLASIFFFVDTPLRLLNEFFERNWSNGSHTVTECAHAGHNSSIFAPIKKAIKSGRGVPRV